MSSDATPVPTGPPKGLETNRPLDRLTSLELGGKARFLAEVEDLDSAIAALRWAALQSQPVQILAGGSNLVVADGGFDGLVLKINLSGVSVRREGERALVTAAAGENWDGLVERAVGEGLAGIECLSGIPGTVGATPIQNVGAYGQEVAPVIERVEALDLAALRTRSLSAEDCGFGYRDSHFRRHPGRWLVVRVTFGLMPGGEPTLAYRELRDLMRVEASSPNLEEVRSAVLELRRSKSMVLDPDDPNHRSVGSFFVNPVLDSEALARLVSSTSTGIPRFEVDGAFKVPAGWLIEQAGFHRGLRRGSVGISSNHTLALVNHGEGTTKELLDLAREIRDGVEERFGIVLQPEPVFVGFGDANPLA
ncbi:MAG: UDP-N-acetylmuramate dehydrogenase [Holophagae bacterium]|jgi:UDP-N-acetylmuramate dehydrogenase